MKPIRVLVVGCGHMGECHALAYHESEDFEIVGLVSRGQKTRELLSKKLGGYPTYADYEQALSVTKPDAVCISTYPDTHAAFAKLALLNDCHVFLEKPLATNLDEARDLVALSHERNKKLVVGYILQHHPSWIRFVEESKGLGVPLVMRMNLNQQSSGAEWITHKNILSSMSPIVDCGVHYVDVMCRITGARATSVHAICVALSSELPPSNFNYGQLQVTFDDGSVGWYEAGWGPMMSRTAHFVKDVIGPKGSVSIAAAHSDETANVQDHTKTDTLILHSSALDPDGNFVTPDRIVSTQEEPDHNKLCCYEQEFFARAIAEDLDLTDHLTSALDSLEIVLAADLSARSQQTIYLRR